MPQKPPPGSIDAAKLFAGTPKSTLAEWRNVGILPEPISVPLGRGRGSASYYPPGTDALFARLREPGRAIQDRDALIWDLWFDAADYPVNIRRWVLKRIDKFLTALNDPRLAELVSALKNPEQVRALISTLRRRHPVHVISGNLRDSRALATLLSWAADIAVERDPAVSLYHPQSQVLASLLKAGGLSPNLTAPDKEINPEMVSVAYLREVMAKPQEEASPAASEEEIAQVRSDCRAIAVLAGAAEAVDWNAVSRALDHDAAFVALTSTEPSSYRTRRTERHAQRKNQLQPQVVRTLLKLWGNFDLRALAVPALVYIRRSPEHAKILSEIIALAHMALTVFPRRASETTQNPTKIARSSPDELR